MPRLYPIVALLSCLALLASPVGALAAGQGLQGGWAIDDSGGLGFAHGLQRQLPLIEDAGAGWVRINFRLGAAYRRWDRAGPNGHTAIELYDTLVDDARDRGLKVLGLLSNESWPGSQDDWIAGNAEKAGGNGDNRYLKQFSRNAALPLAKHFRGRVSAWEVWNEPNAWTSNPAPSVYRGGTFIYPSNFAWLLRHVYEDAHRKRLGDATFVSGGIFGHDQGGASMVTREGRIVKQGDYAPRRDAPSALSSGADYLRATFEQGKATAGWERLRGSLGSYPLDAVGQHLYVDQGGPTSAAKIRDYLDSLRASYAAFEGADTSTKTIVTEFGWTTASVSEQTQAANLRAAYAAFDATEYVKNGYWFSVQDVPEAGLFYGLQSGGDGPEYDGQAKPAMRAYREAAGN